MSTNFDRYLEKRANLARWPLHAGSVQGLDTVVVVPVYAERETLPATLDSLARNPQASLETTLILCVVNNTAQSAPDAIRENADMPLSRIAIRGVCGQLSVDG
ncbi:MAG: glycosyltransferase family 2 protein [Candidatus Hydrogenedentes bacterium]|nr:glycosyltransferase family 2 protein [Candidatus Hydrogenedentota bacterium]